MFVGPYDDGAATLSKHLSNGSYVSDWARTKGSSDYRLSHASSSRTGASAAFKAVGRSVTLGVLKGPYGGYADIYVDGVKRSRLSLYATKTLYRQQVRVASFTSSGRHRVEVRVVGSHPTGSTGNYVFLDSFSVG